MTMGGSPRPLASAPPSEAERLLALSIVLDGRLDEPGRLATARLAARLGFGVWWREPPLVGQPVTGTTAHLAAVVGAAHPVPAGLIADLASPSGAAALAALAAYAVSQPGAEHGPPGAGLRLALAGPPERVSAALARLPAAGLSLAVDYRAVGPGRPVPPAATLLVTTLAAEDLSTAWPLRWRPPGVPTRPVRRLRCWPRCRSPSAGPPPRRTRAPGLRRCSAGLGT